MIIWIINSYILNVKPIIRIYTMLELQKILDIIILSSPCYI